MMLSRTVVVLAVCAVALGAPAPAPAPEPAPHAADDDKPEIIEIIAPAASAQETLATLNLGAPGSELSERNKRTIGILRQLFPQLTQIIEQKVQQITSFVLKTFGPVVLRSFLGGGGGGGAATGGGGSGTIELDDDDDDDDDDAEPLTSSTTSTTTEAYTSAADAAPSVDVTATASPSVDVTAAASPSVDVTAAASDDETSLDDAPAANIKTLADDSSAEDAPAERRRRALYFQPTAGVADQNGLLSGAESQQAEVRVAFDDQQPAASEDQQAAAQTASIDEISLDDADDSEADRNKRFLSFGGQAGAGGGGSGNFLFDVVRLVAGSSSGSSGAGEGGEGEEGAKGDNLTEGVPGPITRLFIIANRGIANLIQDLILRIAQTSERIVNFKARLITSII